MKFKGDADSIEAAITELTAFIEGLGVPLSEQIHHGYPHTLLDRDQ
ncbi:hypothetical protein [Actinomadura rubrisoli]|nr:hypothetical protein [Actinomadura rubrisoli]